MFRKIYPLLAALLLLLCLGSLGMWFAKREGAGKLTWKITARPTVMTIAYKAYGNPNAVNGFLYLSKTVLKNAGEGLIKNLEVTHQVPGQIAWTTPEKYPEMLPGQTIVNLFYPKFPAAVAQFTSATTADLETRFTWEENGARREEIVRNAFDFRSVNEIEWTSMPASEIVTWFDQFENSPMCAAFVTTDDPVVKRFASAITKYSGGTTAGISGGSKEVLRLMKAFYDYQVLTGMRYTGAKGVPEKLGDVRTIVQNVRLPRDVIQNGNGLCIELAILWAAVMEHMGVETKIACIPGHAFPIVMADGQPIPIESTAIGGGPNGPVDFETALKIGQQNVKDAGNVMILLNISDLQRNGLRPPELPNLDMKDVQESIDARERSASQRAQAAQKKAASTEPARAGTGSNTSTGNAMPPNYNVINDPDGAFMLAMPRGWQANPQAVAASRTNAPWYAFAGSDGKSLSVEVYRWPGTNSIKDALAQIDQFSNRMGVAMGVDSTSEITWAGHSAVRIIGSTKLSGGTMKWTSVWVATGATGVIAIVASAPSAKFSSSRPTLDTIVNTLRVRTGE